MQIVDAGIEKYIEQHTSSASSILEKIDRETNLRSIYPRMLSGKVQGKFLTMVSRMINPKYILEIGTFTGYSAICLAEGLAENGELHTLEINEELENTNSDYFKEAKLKSKIIAHYGNALDILPQLDIKFDLVFIDADKINYVNYFELCMQKLRIGGFILADNVLWSGKVLLNNDSNKVDKDADAIRKFNKLIQQDKRVENVMIPLRDGMTLIYKKC